MSKNTKVWNIPEGYEIDKEQSNESKIVLKKIENKKIENKRVSSWKEYCEKMKGKKSYFFFDIGDNARSSKFDDVPLLSEFEDRKDTEALAAFSKLLRLRKDWVGNWKPDWTCSEPTFIIVNSRGNVNDGVSYNVSSPMIFPTEEMRDEFFDTFRDLLEIAKPLL